MTWASLVSQAQAGRAAEFPNLSPRSSAGFLQNSHCPCPEDAHSIRRWHPGKGALSPHPAASLSVPCRACAPPLPHKGLVPRLEVASATCLRRTTAEGPQGGCSWGAWERPAWVVGRRQLGKEESTGSFCSVPPLPLRFHIFFQPNFSAQAWWNWRRLLNFFSSSSSFLFFRKQVHSSGQMLLFAGLAGLRTPPLSHRPAEPAELE